jgi:multidrug efflux pump subunit AcrA (membrane-fusion protein)
MLRYHLPATLLFIAAAAAQTDSPAAVRQTEELNRGQAAQAGQTDAQYQSEQQLYQKQQQDYQAQKQQYDSQAARYLAARDRYAAERARYRRGDWPKRYEKLVFVENDALLGAPVETYSGADVGKVVELARRNGHVDAVRIALDDGKSLVWVDRGDLKFDTEDRLLVTDLARHDLYSMSAEQY